MNVQPMFEFTHDNANDNSRLHVIKPETCWLWEEKQLEAMLLASARME